jgi:hypothetical protein
MSGIISGSSTQSSGGGGGADGGTTDSDQRRPRRGLRGGRGLSKDQGHYIDPRLQDELAERI